MNDRVVNLAGALGVVLILVMLALNPDVSQYKPAGVPTSIDQQSNGYALAYAWLKRRGEEVHSLQDRYSALTRDFPGGGHLLVTALPQSSGARLRESDQLQDWLDEGNTVLVLASLLNDSGSERAGDTRINLRRLTGLHLSSDESSTSGDESANVDEASDNNDAPSAAPVYQQKDAGERPNDDASDVLSKENIDAAIDVLFADPIAPVLVSDLSTHPLVAGVSRIAGRASSFPTTRARAIENRTLHHHSGGGAILALLHRDPASLPGEPDANPVEPPPPVEGAWLDVRGEASFIVVGLSTLFDNRGLQQADNAQFFANVVEWAVGRTNGARGSVIFDDMHQGLSNLYDPEAFFSDSRLGISILLLLCCWLLYVLGANNRLPGIHAPQPSRPQPADLVRVTGGFLASRENEYDSAQRLFEHFFAAAGSHLSKQPSKHSSEQTGADIDQRFARLESAQRLPQSAVAALKKTYVELQNGKKIDLQKTHELMLTIRNQQL